MELPTLPWNALHVDSNSAKVPSTSPLSLHQGSLLCTSSMVPSTTAESQVQLPTEVFRPTVAVQGHEDASHITAAGVLGMSQSGGLVSAPRLVRSPLAFSGAPFQLTASPRGSLGNVVAHRLRTLTPGRGQLLLRVLAVGVNFRDVLNVLGMYPGDPGEPGGDVAGVVEAVGPGQIPFMCALASLNAQLQSLDLF